MHATSSALVTPRGDHAHTTTGTNDIDIDIAEEGFYLIPTGMGPTFERFDFSFDGFTIDVSTLDLADIAFTIGRMLEIPGAHGRRYSTPDGTKALLIARGHGARFAIKGIDLHTGETAFLVISSDLACELSRQMSEAIAA